MSEIRIPDLYDDIIEACRDAAATLKGFEDGDGAIRLCYIPQGAAGVDLLDGNTCYADRYEVVARIRSSGNYVLNRDGRGEPVDTYAFSALKVAACLRAYELELSARSGEKLGEFYDEAHGFAPYKGAALYQMSQDNKVFGLLIVSVSGATQEEDEEVALAAESAMRKWCERTNAHSSTAISIA